MTSLTERDDLLHPAADAGPWWSETCWFSFDQLGPDLSATIYPLFRPNLGVCSLGVYLWDGSAHEPWKVRYGRAFWQLPMPATDLDALKLVGLRYERLEPLRRFRVRYEDGDAVALDLEFTGLREPHQAHLAEGVGHYDQPCHVVGEVVLRGETLSIDTLGMRDRTWSPRPEDRKRAGTAYTYGHRSADEQFLLLTSLRGNEGSFLSGVFTGYLVRDGEHAPLVDAARRVVERVDGYPSRLEVDAVDELGRRLEATGRTVNRLANQANGPQFAWMSMTAWEVGDDELIGEDQEVWSPDRLGPTLLELNV